MSTVTNLILVTGTWDGDDAVAYLNDYLSQEGVVSGSCRIAKVSDFVTNVSTKSMEAEVFMAAANYLELEPFLEAFRSAPFEFPDDVVLLVKEQDDHIPTLYTYTGD